MILNFVLWCLFGLIAEAIAQFLSPAKTRADRNPVVSPSPPYWASLVRRLEDSCVAVCLAGTSRD